MELFSYIASGIATILGICEPFGKKMSVVLILNFLGNLLVAVSYTLVSSISGAVICFTACVQVVINYFFDANKKKLPIGLIIAYAVVFLLVNLFAFTSWYDLFSLAATMAYVLSMAQSDVKKYRVLYAANSFLWIAYDIMTQSYGNLWTHIILFLSTGAAILLNRKKD